MSSLTTVVRTGSIRVTFPVGNGGPTIIPGRSVTLSAPGWTPTTASQPTSSAATTVSGPESCSDRNATPGPAVADSTTTPSMTPTPNTNVLTFTRYATSTSS